MHSLRLVLALLPVLCFAAGPRVESNIVYGMHGGLALLMDVHHPARPNGAGIIHLTGSGWHTDAAYDARQQKDSPQVKVFGGRLTEAGYTVFALNHRTPPPFRYPAPLEDIRRGIRYIRHHAARFGIDPNRIGGVGGSSGGHMLLMAGLADSPVSPDDPDPVNRESAKLQCIVPWQAPVDLLARGLSQTGSGNVASLLGMRLVAASPKSSIEYRTYQDASPIYRVAPDAPPVFLIYGGNDKGVPAVEGERLRDALEKAGVPVRLHVVPGGGHGAMFPGMPAGYRKHLDEMAGWFDRYLKP
jgi:acetyl esterase/lipase